MSIQAITPEELVPAILQEVATPKLRGLYELVFFRDSAFSDQALSLRVVISESGQPHYIYPVVAPSQVAYKQALTSYVSEREGKFRDRVMVFLVRHRESHNDLERAWLWKLETNGHLTPEVDDSPEARTLATPGWAINHPDEVFINFVEHMQLLNQAAEEAKKRNVDKFKIKMHIDLAVETIVAKKTEGKGFALDRADFPEAYFSFKNGSYTAMASYLTVVIGEETWRWTVEGKRLVPEGDELRKEGWSLEISEEEAEELMDALTVEQDHPTSVKAEEKRNSLAKQEHSQFLESLFPEDAEKTDLQRLLYIFFDSPVDGRIHYSTMISKIKEGYIVEIPEVLDSLINPEEIPDSYVVVQEIDESEETEEKAEEMGMRFQYRGWKMQKSEPVSELENSVIIDLLENKKS